MRPRLAVSSFFSALLLLPIAVFAQSTQDQSASVPRLITITGVYRPADGKAPGAVETVTLVDLRRRSRGARRSSRKPSRSPSTTAAATPSSSAPRHADGIPPTVFADRAVARHRLRTHGRSRRAARPTDQRPLCDARRRGRYARRASGLRLSARHRRDR